MNIRKIAVLAPLVAGAALAFAPSASADIVTTALGGEDSLLNSLFTGEATLAGDSAGISTAGALDTITLADAPNTAPATILDYELYGLNPLANAVSDPGAGDVFNGALADFADSFNAEAYGLLNQNALVPSADLIPTSDVTAALATGSDTGAAALLLQAGVSDLTGFFDFSGLTGGFDLASLLPGLIP